VTRVLKEAFVNETTTDQHLYFLTADDGHEVRGQLPCPRAEHHLVLLLPDAAEPISLWSPLIELYHQRMELAVKF
jgi:hypothetical protein